VRKVASAETAAIVERELRIEASPETVFEFFVDPDRMIQWMGRQAELDPRPGGTFRVDLNGRHVSRGEYVEVDRPNRVVFTFGWEGGTSVVQPGTSTVEVSLSVDGEGTLVRFAHRDLPEESRDSHGHGWDHYFQRLAVAASGGDPGEDPWRTPEGAEAGQQS
jgi:uncharacterized protein YndB with AHSA1/START domain